MTIKGIVVEPVSVPPLSFTYLLSVISAKFPVCIKFATLIPHISTDCKPADALPFQTAIPLVAPNASLIYIPFSQLPGSEEKSYVMPEAR